MRTDEPHTTSMQSVSRISTSMNLWSMESAALQDSARNGYSSNTTTVRSSAHIFAISDRASVSVSNGGMSLFRNPETILRISRRLESTESSLKNVK